MENKTEIDLYIQRPIEDKEITSNELISVLKKFGLSESDILWEDSNRLNARFCIDSELVKKILVEIYNTFRVDGYYVYPKPANSGTTSGRITGIVLDPDNI